MLCQVQTPNVSGLRQSRGCLRRAAAAPGARPHTTRTSNMHRPQLLAPLTTSWRKAPPDLAISSCGEPNSTSLPASSTMILSASRTDESRCAMVSTVAWPNAERTVRWMSACQQVELRVQKKKERCGGAGGPAEGARIRLGVDGGRRLVEQHERAAREQRARDAEELPLARREVGAVLRLRGEQRW